jgi:hypothetical protein
MTSPDQEVRPSRNYPSLIALGASLCLLILGVVAIVPRVWSLPATTCTLDTTGVPIPPDMLGLPNYYLVALGVTSIGLGRLFGSWRESRMHLLPSGPRAFSQLNRTIVTAVVVVIFLGVSFALFYEALGVMRVAQGSILQPITYYTRCAIHYDIHPDPTNLSLIQFPWITTLVTASMCFVFGHWFWYPYRTHAHKAA